MFKNIIAPAQAWLLSQSRCVGCGTSLKNGKRTKNTAKEEKVTCKKCGRIYLYNSETKRYRRALLSDAS